MSKRKSVGPRLRFDVFKRDAFTCQYCGQTPPTVILHIDHIVPVANGGTNDEVNLITSCVDCNTGKGCRELGQVPAPLATQIAERRERSAQVREYNAFLMEQRQELQDAVYRLGKHWYRKFNEVDCHVFGPSRSQSIKTFLKHLVEAQLWDFIDIAFVRVGDIVDGDDEDTWKYFCGACWRQIKGDRPHA